MLPEEDNVLELSTKRKGKGKRLDDSTLHSMFYWSGCIIAVSGDILLEGVKIYTIWPKACGFLTITPICA